MEDLISKAYHNYILGRYNSVITILNSELVKSNYEAIFLKACVYINMRNYEMAVNELNEAEKLNPNYEVYFKKGIAYFNQKDWVLTNENFKKCMHMSNTNDQREKLTLWINKLETEIKDNNVILTGNIDSSTIKIIHNWYQTNTNVIVTLDCNTEIDNNFKVNLAKKNINVTHSDYSVYNVNLSNSIDVSKSSYEVSKKKITLNLKKEIDNFNWVTLDFSNPDTASTFKPSYPTSCKVKKNWDSLDKEIERELGKEVAAEDGMMKLFKEIYERGDENTRKAMIKSFQTSSGTVLSTNWNEVSEKDYEGKDKPDAPKGQEWANK